MFYYSVVFLIFALIFLLYNLFKIIGKDIGYGSSATNKELMRDSACMHKQKNEESVVKGDDSTGFDKSKIHNFVVNKSQKIIKITDLKLNSEDKQTLIQFDKDSTALCTQNLVDGFYIFGQKIIERQLCSLEQGDDKCKNDAKHHNNIMESFALSLTDQQHEQQNQTKKIWKEYFDLLFKQARDVDFLAFKLLGLKNIKIQNNKLYFQADTNCTFNLYKIDENNNVIKQAENVSLFIWSVYINLPSWQSNQWKIEDLTITNLK